MTKKAKLRVTSITATAAPLGEMPGMHDYQAESDGRHLKAAEEIKADKARHGRALDHLKRQHEEIGKVLGERSNPGGDRVGQGYRRIG